ncbi:NAD(P)/FAD-dependent oxidoreductase [Bordetella sp. 02P26C-1]|uniref:NAD(P)/FAD-dependent oxidoreductase n=1 Tax=Bordetella sp. 02P26C-1 TaxID=2683195 RepID=UPI001354B51C|nr:FAD-binding oxidoreductase [Bordetella sp. 02P26C-1]MVW78259.1 FAD-dependent oxidoreductase [Bordetella sp. 02P26C-1]
MTDRMDVDVLIVGGGLVGAASALYLAKRGVKALVIERRYCGAQASGVNYGGVRCQGRTKEQMPLALRARRIWNGLPELIGIDGEFTVSGHLRLGRNEADLDALAAWAKMAESFGLSASIIDGAPFRARYPWLSRAVIGGSLCPSDGHANPRLVSPAFARAAVSAGAMVLEQTELTEIAFDGNHFHAQAGEHRVRAKWCINAAGAWANQLAETFGEKTPLEPMYPNMWVTEPLPRFIPHNLGIYGGGFYARQVDRGNCVLGGGMARGDDRFAQPSDDVTLSVMREAQTIIPALKQALVIRSWSGLDGKTPDRNPVIGPSRTTPRLLHAFGFSGGGFMLAPGVGEILAELVCDGETETPIDAFSIDRFAA